MISVIALLIALLLPALEGARFAAKIAICGSQIRQLHIGIWRYAEDHDGKLIRHPELPEYQVEKWDWNTISLMRTYPKNISFLPYFNDETDVFSCPDGGSFSYSRVGNVPYVLLGYSNLCNINPQWPGQPGVYDPSAAARLVAKTINDEPNKGMWADSNYWTAAAGFGGLNIWPWWTGGSHPKRNYKRNPELDGEGRWLVTLGGSASWDHWVLPDSDSKAQRRRLLLQAGSSWYLSY